jgi:phospholipase C
MTLTPDLGAAPEARQPLTEGTTMSQEPAMPQIKTVVHLMLENRSFDTMLGWLYAKSKPQHVFPEDSEAGFLGIRPGDSNSYEGKSYTPAEGTSVYEEPCRVPNYDPHEPYKHVKVQMYADDDGKLQGTPWKDSPPMTGFAYDYHGLLFDKPEREVMGAYSAAELPVLYGLAENFAVSDRWFASIPTQTDANRAFSICGTSLGGVDNGDPKRFDTKTIFNALSGTRSWGIYYQNDGPASGDPDWPLDRICYTADIFPQIRSSLKAGFGEVEHYCEFLNTLATGGDLPEFCYLEPSWGGGFGDFFQQGNDYHPPAFVGPAEADLNTLYEALVKSKQWPNMLFIITFDEHGGTWDHLPSKKSVQPDGHTYNVDHHEEFCFDWLGVRVPTILVSPFVRPGTVFRAPSDSAYDFDHTSVIATLLKWSGIDPASAGLGKRVAAAPTFQGVLSDTRSTTPPPHFEVPSGYAEQGGGAGHFHAFDLDIRDVNIRDFRDACDTCDSEESFKARLEVLVAQAAAAKK